MCFLTKLFARNKLKLLCFLYAKLRHQKGLQNRSLASIYLPCGNFFIFIGKELLSRTWLGLKLKPRIIKRIDKKIRKIRSLS